MTWDDFKSWMGTALMLYGLGVLGFAFLVGGIAAFAEALGADRGQMAFLAITAALWGIVGMYFCCWGHRVRDHFLLP